MTLREFLKSTEAIIVIAAFVLIIFFNSRFLAWAGLIAYILVNIEGGVDKVVRIWKRLAKWLKITK